MKRMRELWQSRSRPERALLVALALIAGVALYAWLLHSASQARTRLKIGVPALAAQAARLERQAAEYEGLRDTPAKTPSPADLRALLRAEAEAAGLSRALASVEGSETHRARVLLNDARFADWLAWTDKLQARQVRIEACRIDASSRPGVVNVSASFVRDASS